MPDKEMVITRVFDAPRELVYKAFIDPDQLAEWFGPVGWSVPRETVDVDARPGGHQRLVMVSDDDPEQRAPIDATFTEVVENELLEGTESSSEVTLTLRVEFHDDKGKTRIVLRQGPFTEDMLDMTREGWGSSFTKLDKVLAG